MQPSLHVHQLHNNATLFFGVQEKQEDLASVVRHVKKKFGVESVYCWHALHAYWSGVSPAAPGTQSYGSQITYPTPTPGEITLISVLPCCCSCYAHGIAESVGQKYGVVHTVQHTLG